MPRGWNKGTTIHGAATLTIEDPRIQPVPESGCWLWVGGVSPKGYGRVNRPPWCVGDPSQMQAHRAVWIRHNGSIPDGLVLDHMCRERSCVNPDHLRVVTPRVNSVENSLAFSAVNAEKDCCPKCGGSYRTTRRTRRERHCRPCSLASLRATRALRVRQGLCGACGKHELATQTLCMVCRDALRLRAARKLVVDRDRINALARANRLKRIARHADGAA